MRHLIPTLALAIAAFSPGLHAACFTGTDRANAVVYEGNTSPIDLSKPISEGIADKYPGGHLVVSILSCGAA